MKKVAILLFLCVFSLTAIGQKNKLLTPVTYAQVVNEVGVRGVDKVANGAFIWRIKASLAANVSKFDPETNKVKSYPLSRVGAGMSYAHYIPVDGVPVNNYSFDALVLVPTDGFTNVAFAVTASAYNVELGLIYDVVKGQSFKYNIGLMTGITIKF